jgi:hypothetical protein
MCAYSTLRSPTSNSSPIASFAATTLRTLHTARAALLLACIAAPAWAQPPPATPPELQPIEEPPPVPGRVQSGEALEPDVRISRRDQATVTEYLVNGRLRAIKVQPDGEAPPYYLYDTDGDGRLDRRDSRFDPDLLIPRWVIFSW